MTLAQYQVDEFRTVHAGHQVIRNQETAWLAMSGDGSEYDLDVLPIPLAGDA